VKTRFQAFAFKCKLYCYVTFPQMYELQWKPIEATTGSGAAAIHWKKIDGYDASGRAVLKEVYSQAMGGAVLGFEVNLEAILERAKQTQRDVHKTITETEKVDVELEENPAVVAAASSELLAVLREAAADAAAATAASSSPAMMTPCPMYVFVSRSRAVQVGFSLPVGA
jgi:hypothetical protein